MVDRAPTKPNRYAVYDENHNFIRYEYHERADEPTQVGDALNKANLLPDAVATALGLTGNPQVKDALEKIKTLVDGNTTLANSKSKVATGSYTGTGTYGESNRTVLTFGGRPKFVIIAADELMGIFVYNSNYGRFFGEYNVVGRLPSTWRDASLSFYDTKAANRQFNASGTVYKYVVAY